MVHIEIEHVQVSKDIQEEQVVSNVVYGPSSLTEVQSPTYGV